MKIFIFNLSQTPVKPILPAWLRVLFQFDVCKNVLLKLSNTVGYVRYVDDTGLQVAKLMAIKDKINLPESNIGDYLGTKYVEANRIVSAEMAAKTKLDLEENPIAGEYFKSHLIEQQKLAVQIKVNFGETFWESSVLGDIPALFADLANMGVLLDYSKYGGDVLLDFTHFGMKLITLKGNSGYTFLTKLLVSLNKLIKNYDLVVLQYIDEDQNPYKYVCKYFDLIGKCYKIISSSRVKLAGNSKSSRYGGWEEFTLDKILARFNTFIEEDVCLGMRLYFLTTVNDDKRFDFDFAALRQKLILAADIRKFVERNKSKISNNKRDFLTMEAAFKPSSVCRKLVGSYGKLKSGQKKMEVTAWQQLFDEFIYLLEVINA